MKKSTFIHALILTPFEEAILGQDIKNWEFVAQQDYCVHALYHQEKQKLIFFGTNLTQNITEQIDSFIGGARCLGAPVIIEKKIFVLNFGEDELDRKTVVKLFRQ